MTALTTTVMIWSTARIRSAMNLLFLMLSPLAVLVPVQLPETWNAAI